MRSVIIDGVKYDFAWPLPNVWLGVSVDAAVDAAIRSSRPSGPDTTQTTRQSVSGGQE